MFKYIINWIWSLFKKTGKRINFEMAGHKIEGYMFVPPVYRKKKLIVSCHGGWGSYPDVPKLKDVNYYVNCGYNVFVLRYEDEFTPEPYDLNIEKDVADVYYTYRYYEGGFKSIFLLGASRGGFVTLQFAIKYNLYKLIIAMCAPSDIEAWEAWGIFKQLGEGSKPYFYQWPSPIKSAQELSRRPLILIHGIEDDLVPPTQSTNLFKEIQKFGVVILKIFMDRGHALMDDPPVTKYVAERLGRL